MSSPECRASLPATGQVCWISRRATIFQCPGVQKIEVSLHASHSHAGCAWGILVCRINDGRTDGSRRASGACMPAMFLLMLMQA